MTRPVTVSVAVVSWNTRELLLRCLRSLSGEAETGRAEVWVVDNGSSDGSAAAARTQAPWAGVIEAGENLGFGRAVNLAARESRSRSEGEAPAQAEWLLVANADVALEPGALDAMLAAGADPRVGAVAPTLIAPDGRIEHSVHPFPTLGFTVAFNLGLPAISRRLGDRLCLEGSWDSGRPRFVPWAIGACLLVRREAFDDVGGFDERQWMYAEDLELAWRMRDRGWLTRYEPRARVLHQSGAATRAAFGDDRAPRFMSATYALLLGRRGARVTKLTAWANIAGAAARIGWMAPLAAVSPRWRSRMRENRRWLRAHREGLRNGCRYAGRDGREPGDREQSGLVPHARTWSGPRHAGPDRPSQGRGEGPSG